MSESNLVQNIGQLKNLPKTWVIRDFTNIVSDNSGGNKKLAKTEFLESGVIAIVDQGKELIAGYYDNLNFAVKTKPPYIVFGDHTRIFKFIDFPFVMGADGTKVLQPKDNNCSTKYLYYFFLSINIPETGYNRHFKYLKELQIPLPPLPQQKKIAAILDAADAYRQKTKALIAKYDELTQSLFLDMFGDPVKNEKGFEFKPLSDFIKCLNTGVSVNSTDEDFKSGFIGILKTSCVYTGVFRPDEAKVIRDDEFERIKLNPKSDSIIISRMNTTELVGKSAYIFKDYPELFLPDRLWQTEKGKLPHNVRWLSYALSLKSFMNEIGKISSGTSGSMKNISKKNYLNLFMIYPSINSQNQFAERVEAIEEQKAQAQASLEKAEELFNSLLQKAFKGELV
jgi:type I restriction enzyme S subunit